MTVYLIQQPPPFYEDHLNKIYMIEISPSTLSPSYANMPSSSPSIESCSNPINQTQPNRIIAQPNPIPPPSDPITPQSNQIGSVSPPSDYSCWSFINLV